MSTSISAFLDGNNLVHFGESSGKLYVGNESGILKIFNPGDINSEPVSLDTPEFLTSLKTFGNRVFFTNTHGVVGYLDLSDDVVGDETYTKVHEAPFPLRDLEIINEGKRIICVGDMRAIVIIDLSQNNKIDSFPMHEDISSVSYNPLGEMITLVLSNGDPQVYSVANEKPELVATLNMKCESVIRESEFESIDYHDKHSEELICTRALWSSTGEDLYVPSFNGCLTRFLRSDWSQAGESSTIHETLVALDISPNKKFVASVFKNGVINIHSLANLSFVKTLKETFSEALPISLAWADSTIFVGATKGELRAIPISLENEATAQDKNNGKAVANLFLEEASDSENEDLSAPSKNPKKRDALDDSSIIDEDDEMEDAENPFRYHNRPVEDVISERYKKARFSSEAPKAAISPGNLGLIPYSPGSTPWIKSANSSSNATKRRYLFMNATGYAWSVKNDSGDSSDIQKSVTVSFFDRSINKDYHFIDYYDYDLCSMNERGILLGCSGYQADAKAHKGRVFYRHHVNTSDSWDRQIPLLDAEYITSICITSSSAEATGDSIVVVGTNFGYLRFFNLYGLCINIMKVSPVISIISSAINTVFGIHQSGNDSFSYSIISVPEDYKFYQQECNLPLASSKGLLIKGLFFNDHSDPCLVAGQDDTLAVLSHWREPGNARWIPVLNCANAVSDFGLSESKRNWNCWPLGLQQDKTVCLILKNNDVYPGFPLPLPVELDLRLPTKCFKSLLKKQKNVDFEEDEIADDSDDIEAKLQKVKEDDPEEEFLRVSTLGKLLASSLNDLGDEEEHMDTLKNYSLVFDRSLLKLFNSACQESRLNKAFSVVKLIKNDKALLAATKIAERHSFSNLMAKINNLREELLEMQDDDNDDDDD